ncbi:39S ribosomal protein L53, mitochondrial-like [Eriocheir sinensis]|uniref:39S ribosomal protein L53, mitochondrial-like n=1 Tax=Eriocheir sinensis TaxID=95602 RepID=UPI0021C63812|nr:39S ribosomal protein L53, mitochondrial-like [Eriocheir sinensis]
MALPWHYHGSLTRSAGLYSALGKQAKLLSLKPVAKIEFTFDPFTENAVVVRNLSNYFYQEKVRDTNLKCILKTNIVNTRAEPTVLVKLVDNKKILFKANNLQTLEILQKYNELVSSKAKAEESTEVAKPKQTKSQKRR